MIEFTQIQNALWGAAGAIVWVLCYFRLLKKPEIHLSGDSHKGFNSLKFIFLLLGLFAWALITYSLSGPKKPVGNIKNKVEVNDIFFVVDVSRSMLADDFYPNRLEVAKQKILDFVELRPSDRIGLVVFSEKVFTLLPLSTDLNLIKEMVKEVNVGVLGSGTNIGDALGLTVGRAAGSLAKNKVIILLTDGVSNVGVMTPLQAAEEAARQKVKVYTIGIGGKQNAKIPNGAGGFQYIPGGSIDIETLQKISKETKGKFYLAQDEKSLAQVLSEIERLERTEVDLSSRVVYKEMYWNYLLYGVSLLLLVELSRKVILREVA